MEIVDWLLHVGRNNPDLVAIILGTLAGNVASLLVERYVLPETMGARKQQGISVLVAFLAGAILSDLTWKALDAADTAYMRGTISVSAALIAVIVYPAVARWATSKWPAIGSIWAAK